MTEKAYSGRSDVLNTKFDSSKLKNKAIIKNNSTAPKNKTEFIEYVKKQTGVSLSNDKKDPNNSMRKVLHTHINRDDYEKISRLFSKQGIRIENHTAKTTGGSGDYFIYYKR